MLAQNVLMASPASERDRASSFSDEDSRHSQERFERSYASTVRSVAGKTPLFPVIQPGNRVVA